MAFLQSQVDKWEPKWNPKFGDQFINTAVSEFHNSCEHALSQVPSNPMPASNFVQAVETYLTNSLGRDNWSRDEIAGLPVEEQHKLSDSTSKSIKSVAASHQNLLNLNASLGEPSGDTRTITRFLMLYRMALRASEDIREWEIKHSALYDKAQVGSWALIAAPERNLRADLAYWLGKYSIAVFNDYGKFFVMLDIPTLLSAAIKKHNFHLQFCFLGDSSIWLLESYRPMVFLQRLCKCLGPSLRVVNPVLR